MELVADLTLVLLAALVGGFVAQRLGQPLIVGYIVAGVVVGPFTGGPTVGNVHDIEQLAELGVVLLLFSLGLELSFRGLAPVRTVALVGATIQIILTIALGLGLGLALGWAWRRPSEGRYGRCARDPAARRDRALLDACRATCDGFRRAMELSGTVFSLDDNPGGWRWVRRVVV